MMTASPSLQHLSRVAASKSIGEIEYQQESDLKANPTELCRQLHYKEQTYETVPN
jgi:hypothetical protein